MRDLFMVTFARPFLRQSASACFQLIGSHYIGAVVEGQIRHLLTRQRNTGPLYFLQVCSLGGLRRGLIRLLDGWNEAAAVLISVLSLFRRKIFQNAAKWTLSDHKVNSQPAYSPR